jgi:hypothetical protein
MTSYRYEKRNPAAKLCDLKAAKNFLHGYPRVVRLRNLYNILRYAQAPRIENG